MSNGKWSENSILKMRQGPLTSRRGAMARGSSILRQSSVVAAYSTACIVVAAK